MPSCRRCAPARHRECLPYRHRRIAPPFQQDRRCTRLPQSANRLESRHSVTNTTAAVIAAILVSILILDAAYWDQFLLFAAARRLDQFIEYLAFWR